MKKITLIILAFIVCVSASAKKKKATGKQAHPGKIESVQIFRTGCFGKCPTYSVEINRNGIVTYIAVRFCADSGTFNKNIGKDKAMAIINRADSVRIDTCQDVYDSRASDLPGLIYTIKYKNKVKNIRNARWGPTFLPLLARDIDNAGKKVDNVGWKKVMPPTKR
jgi:hypothetical protein